MNITLKKELENIRNKLCNMEIIDTSKNNNHNIFQTLLEIKIDNRRSKSYE